MFFLGIDPEKSVFGIGCSYKAGQIERDGKHESEIVICMLADQIHAAWSAKYANTLVRPVMLAKGFKHHGRVRASTSITPPKASITRPQ